MIPKEDFTLKGHRSIVNSVLFHPDQPIIVTAGVEKIVRQFSPFPFSTDPCMFLFNVILHVRIIVYLKMYYLDTKSTTVERVPAESTSIRNMYHVLYGVDSRREAETTEENMTTLAFFDLMVCFKSFKMHYLCSMITAKNF